MKRRLLFCVLATPVLAGALAAQDIPLSNWTVPPYAEADSGGFTTMTDIASPRVFIPTQPCRVVDTRGGGFTGAYGPPIVAAGATRTFDINSAPHCPGIPATATAYSLNFTVTQTAGSPGDIRAWPTGNPPIQITSVLNWTVPGATLANATIMPAGTNGAIDVQVAGSNTHLLIDINGYFAHTADNNVNFLEFDNNSPGQPTAFFGNASSTNSSAGVFGRVGSAFPRPGGYVAAGVRGEGRAGLLGLSQEFGAVGSLISGGNEVAYGVLGHHVDLAEPEITGDNVGVFGVTFDNIGGHAGVLGYAPSSAAPGGTGRVYGVRGVTASTALNAAGVRGTDGGGSVLPADFTFFSAGVRGESLTGHGLLGITATGNAVTGCKTNGGSGCASFATLGFSSNDGLLVGGGSILTGAQTIVEPHPTDASKVLRLISLEGNEAGTYFRGRGKFQNGIAVIDVPEVFRIVTAPAGLSIQVTPIGQMATIAVESIDLDRIVVRGSRNVEFFYTVNGVRSAYNHHAAIAENERLFVPQSADEPMPAYLPAALKKRLISNGTYTADGKVNMDTAKRLGWDKIWERRSRPAPQTE